MKWVVEEMDLPDKLKINYRKMNTSVAEHGQLVPLVSTMYVAVH
jgi:hypothetical protein